MKNVEIFKHKETGAKIMVEQMVRPDGSVSSPEASQISKYEDAKYMDKFDLSENWKTEYELIPSRKFKLSENHNYSDVILIIEEDDPESREMTNEEVFKSCIDFWIGSEDRLWEEKDNPLGQYFGAFLKQTSERIFRHDLHDSNPRLVGAEGEVPLNGSYGFWLSGTFEISLDIDFDAKEITSEETEET